MLRFAPPAYRQFIAYCLVGLVSNALCFVLFLLLIALGVAPVAATGICYIAGMCLAYFGNHLWAFGGNSTHRSDLPRFILAYGGGLLASLAIMWALLRYLAPPIAQLLTMGLTAVAIFTLLKLTGFGRETPDHAD